MWIAQLSYWAIHLGKNIWLLITPLMEGNNSLMEVNIIYNQFLYKANGTFTGFPESIVFG